MVNNFNVFGIVNGLLPEMVFLDKINKMRKTIAQ